MAEGRAVAAYLRSGVSSGRAGGARPLGRDQTPRLSAVSAGGAGRLVGGRTSRTTAMATVLARRPGEREVAGFGRGDPWL
jgi:hypothetical protein